MPAFGRRFVLYLFINIFELRNRSLPARTGEKALAVPGLRPSVPARRGEGPSQCRGCAPPFWPAGANVPRSTGVAPLRPSQYQG